MEFEDKLLLCLECCTEFDFPAAQQQEFAERGFHQEPKRCPACREKRRELTTKVKPPAERRGNSQGPSAFRTGPRPRPPRVMYPATCAACGRQTQVPFRPLEGRAVYCRECHELKKQAIREIHS